VAVADGRIFTQADLDGVEHVICLSEKDGSTIWKTAANPGKQGLRDGQGDGPRGTPVVDGDRVYAEGGKGTVSCLEAATGKLLWKVELAGELGGDVPGWGYSESPLVVGQGLIVTPGGKRGTLAALNKMTGEVVWRSQDLTEAAHYSSPQVATIHGVRQIVQMARESVVGVELTTGKPLWKYTRANNGTANITMPIIDGDRIFASSAYGTGGGCFRLDHADGTWTVTELYFIKKMANHHGGIVKVADHLYGFGSGGLLCVDFNTGQIAWTDKSVSKGSLISADGLLFLLGERHQLALAKVDPAAYTETGRLEIDDLGKPSWAHPAIANGRLYIRNQQRLTAFDIRAAVSAR
jgi:outer membrane protein assembly factor BamB